LTGARGRREATRGGFVEAALALSREGGRDAVTVREVARRAGYSPAAVYGYFEGRPAIVRAVVNEADRLLAARLADVSSDLSGPERLVRLGLAYLAFAHYERETFGLVGSPAAGGPPPAAFAVFRQAAAAGDLVQGPRMDADAIAYAVWSLVHGMAVSLGGDDADDRRNRAILEQVVASFARSA
jgi:AcrR family transcriptional regulator